MMPLLKELSPKNNSAVSFFPVSANSANNKYNWNITVGLFITSLYDIELNKDIKSLEDFKERCKSTIENVLDGVPFWHVIDKMYFGNANVYNISPEMQSLKVIGNDKREPGDERLSKFLVNLLGSFRPDSIPVSKTNFIEQKIKDEFKKVTSPRSNIENATKHSPYIPAMSDIFIQDLEFFVRYPEYFLQNINLFLRLYSFLYTAQISLNIKSWQSPPEIKPCYFILDSEKASKERTKLQLHGHKQVIESSYALFPYLALNESLQDPKECVLPLWKLFDELNDSDLIELNNYAEKFHRDRSLCSDFEPEYTLEGVFSKLLKMFEEQFKKGSTRETAYMNFVKATRELIFSPFEQNRRRAGSFLVLNQDYLLLLTNLCIGNKEKIWLHELLTEFEKRGVFFDKSSEECLIELFERMGNVERMSDSGDAVYVKKTI